MDETYTASLELDTSAFDEAVKKAMAVWDSLKETLKDSDPGFVAAIEKEAEGAKSEYEKISRIFKSLSTENINSGGRIDTFNAVADALEKMGKYIGDAEKIKNITSETGDEVKQIDLGVVKLPGIFKKMTMAVIGVRSAYAGFRKIVSTALQDNIKLSNQFNAVWHVLGAAVTPILQAIANWLIKLAMYLNAFIKGLTGVDLIAKAMKNFNKNAKAATKTLAGFDELNNLDNNNNSDWTSAFKNVDIDTSWVKTLQDFGAYVREHLLPLIVLTLGFLKLIGALDLWKKIPVLGGLLEKIGGLPIWGILARAAGVIGGIVLVAWSLYSIIMDTAEATENPCWENFGKVIQDIGTLIVGVGIIFGSTTALVIGGVVLAVGAIVANIDKIKQWWADNKEVIIGYAKMIKDGIVSFFTTGNFQGLKDVFKGVFGILDKTIFPGIYDAAKTLWKGIKDLFNGNWKDGLIGVFKGLGNGIISVLNGLIRGINAMLTPARALIVALGKVMGKSWSLDNIKIPTIPSLNVGTNYVPNDQLAMLHKGEAVIPKKFNSDEYFSNEETNTLLQTLIDKVDSLELNPYITVKDVGEASVKYQNQQNRLRGRALVNG